MNLHVPNAEAATSDRNDRWVLLGAICWIATALSFAGQAITQAATTLPYSLTANYISDLGAVTCGSITVNGEQIDVCSPWHAVMNGTFIVVGLLTTAGAIATRQVWPRRRLTSWGWILLAVAGAGQVLAGVFPEDVAPGMHILSGVIGIPLAALGILLLGFGVRRTHPGIAGWSVVAGVAGLAGFVLTGAGGAGLGVGTAERLAAYPATIWTTGVGLTLAWSVAKRR